MPRRILGMILCLGCLAAPAAGSGQGAGRPPRVRCELVPELDTLRFRPGSLGRMAIRASNRTDEPVEGRATVYFAKNPNLQYARRLWIPPRSERIERCPIRIPETEAAEANREVRFFWEETAESTRTGNPVGAAAGAKGRLVPLYREALATGLICDLQESGLGETPFYQMLQAAQASRSLSRRVSVFQKQPLALDPNALDALDVLLLASDRLASDPGSLAAVRDWALGGGLLWIMLDRVSADAVSLLLGDAFSCQVVDRIRLTRVAMENRRRRAPQAVEETREFEAPVELVRVLASGATVIHTAAGWPASFWMTFGRGRVLFTTLGAEAWIRPRRPEDPLPDRAYGQLPVAATTPLAELAADFLKPRPPPSVDRAQWTPFLSHQIGYRILDRAAVAAVLSGFCVIVLVLGLWLFRAGRLERLAWMGPIAAVLAAAVLIAWGERFRWSVPATAAIGQWAATAPGTDGAHVSGCVAIYNPHASSERCGSQGEGVFFPDQRGLEGVVRRMAWLDERVWRWENLTLPAGVRTAPLQASVVLDKPIAVRCVFGPNGLSGTVAAGPLRNLEDAVIAAPGRPALAVRWGPQGTWTAGREDVLAEGQYLREALLSDRQQQRREIYRALLGKGAESWGGAGPIFFAWADPLDLGLQFPSQRRTIGSALIQTSLKMERASPGALVWAPPTFLPYRSIPGPEGRNSSPYSNRTGEWVEVRHEAWSWLRFRLPEVLCPLSVREAILTVEIEAPSRRLEVYAAAKDGKTRLAGRDSPLGRTRLKLAPADLLKADADGGITLGVFVGPQSASSSEAIRLPWKIHSIRLEILGQMTSASFLVK